MTYQRNNVTPTKVVGNNYTVDNSLGFKEEVKHCFESYSNQGIDLANDLMSIIANPSARENFVGEVIESLTTSPVFTDKNVASLPFYNNYADRMEQLLQNSLRSIATESALIGYAPIVAYNPFFLKKQWVSCVFKDVLMTEVPDSPIINLAFEKRYLRSLDGTEYAIPDIYYDDTAMATIMDEATGLSIAETPIVVTAFKPYLNIINPTYIPGVVSGDASVELAPGLKIFKVVMTDTQTTPAAHDVPCDITVDMTTHQFVTKALKYDVYNAEKTAVLETLTDELHGTVDFQTGKVTILSSTGKVTSVCLRGKVANRFNNRSLEVIRKVEPLQYVMPESGPRLNTAVTVEDAADALVLQKVDVIADNVDIMGRTLGNMEDFEIRQFLSNSFNAQKAAGVGPHGYESLIVEGGFNTLPYETYNGRISEWMKDAREYFERVISGLKEKLKTSDAIVVAVAHPEIIRFLQDGINWVFSDSTQISGMKIEYNFGVFTTAQDRVHVITSQYVKKDDGIKFILIPTTQELATYKHYKYNVIIDRNYRNPLYTLTPNIMCTHRTLTFEVLPVQGKMTITGREMFSPDSLVRP